MGAGKRNPKTRIVVLNKFGSRCAYCGTKLAIQELPNLKKMTLDHVVPNKSNDINNLYPSCWDCNHEKAHLSVEEFRKYLSIIPILLNKKSFYRTAITFGFVAKKETKKPKKIVFWFEKYQATLLL